MGETRNLIIAITLSVIVIFSWEFYKLKNTPIQNISSIKTELSEEKVSPKNKETLKQEKKPSIKSISIPFQNNKISGKFSTQGLQFNDLTLNNYETKKDSNINIKLLQDHTNEKYFLNLNWFVDGRNLYSKNDVWKLVSGKNLTPDNPVTFKFYNHKDKVTIYRTISIDDDYLFTVNDNISNHSTQNITLNQYGLINKGVKEIDQSLLILHEGTFGVFNETLHEIKYKKLLKKGKIENSSQAGWIGISDKYWFTSIIPDPKKFYHYRFNGYTKNIENPNQDYQQINKFQSDFKSDDITIAPGQEHSSKTLIFAGAKEINLIDKYAAKHNIHLFDRTIDFGILYFLTKPIYLLLVKLNDLFHNFGLAIIALTILIRILLFPLASKSFREISKIRNIHPEISRVKEQCGSDKVRMNREIMGLYKEHKIKPMMGCLPVFVQVFIFFALYKVLFVTIDMRHAEFFWWITDLTAPDPTSILNLFGLIPIDVNIPFGIWPCILGLTMVLQQKLNPTPNDPMQAKVMKFLPYFFTILFAGFPSGLVIYWTFNNTFSIAQQYIIMKKTDKELKAK